jgi:NTF2 fold immunity protein
MRRAIGVLLFLTMVVFAEDSRKAGLRAYVPDEKTAERIAEAVLVSQFGQERVSAQLPLRAVSTSKDLWLVQGMVHEPHGPGGNFGVWINKHSGCIKVMEHMK